MTDIEWDVIKWAVSVGFTAIICYLGGYANGCYDTLKRYVWKSFYSTNRKERLEESIKWLKKVGAL